MELLDRLRQDPRLVRIMSLLAAGGVILVVALGTRSIGSLFIAGAVLSLLLIGALAGLVVAVEKSSSGPNGPELQQLNRMAEQGRQLAIYDRETGFYAYWYFSLRLQEEIARSGRYEESFSVLLIEATKGRVSAEIEDLLFRSLKNCFRSSDLVAHLGNLRFVALLPRTNPEQAQVVSQRVDSAMGKAEVHLSIASYPDDGEDWPSLLQAAESGSQAA